MVDASITFHVPQEGEPAKLIPLIEAMHFEDARFPTVKALQDFADTRGFGSRVEMKTLAAACGLLENDDSDGYLQLSKNGKAVAQLKPDVRADVIHYLLYTAWQADKPSENSFLWSYREVINSLWEKSSVDDLASASKVIAEEVNNLTRQVFTGVAGYESGGVSFSPKSIRGVRKWIEALIPPVIEDGAFSRRHFCPPELALLAIGWVAQRMEGEVGLDFLLTPERREAMCRLCLLEPAALDKVLDWMLPMHSSVVQPGTSAGVYGRFIRFLKWPEIGDLLPGEQPVREEL